ncbi:hypothetical protein [Streptomyces sp. NPDC055134]
MQDEIAGGRRVHRRAGLRVTSGRDKFTLSEDDHAELLARFLEAARGGDLTGLTDLPAEDAVTRNDGGGKVRAALRPVVGRDHVIAFIAGLVTRYSFGPPRVVNANGVPAIALSVDGIKQVVTISVRDERIDGIYAILNPDKLGHVG